MPINTQFEGNDKLLVAIAVLLINNERFDEVPDEGTSLAVKLYNKPDVIVIYWLTLAKLAVIQFKELVVIVV